MCIIIQISLSLTSCREYLFTCVDSSIAVSSELCGRHRLAWPLRDHTGCAVAVLDLCLPSPLLDPEQSSQLWRMAKVLTLCFANLSSVADPIAQHSRDSSADMERYSEHWWPFSRPVIIPPPLGMVVDRGNESVLFEQLLLADLSVAIARLDKRLFAELRSCAQPSTAALPLLQTLLCILYPDRQLETAWEHCRKVPGTLIIYLDSSAYLSFDVKQFMRLFIRIHVHCTCSNLPT